MRDHRSLLAWQEANRTVELLLDDQTTGHPPSAWAVMNQLREAALSVQLNIAEGYAFGRSARFRNHLRIAFGSAVETAELLRLAAPRGWLSDATATAATDSCAKSQKLLVGLIRKLS